MPSKWIITLVALIFLIIALLGMGNYSVFYEEMATRFTGEGLIDWEKIAAVCGWAGQPNPGESVWAYRIRSTWNMISSRMAMTAFTIALMAVFFVLLRFVFWITAKRS